MSTTLAIEQDSLVEPYEPTEKDWADYEAYWETVNLVERLKKAKPNVMPSEWIKLMFDLGKLSSDELCEAATMRRVS